MTPIEWTVIASAVASVALVNWYFFFAGQTVAVAAPVRATSAAGGTSAIPDGRDPRLRDPHLSTHRRAHHHRGDSHGSGTHPVHLRDWDAQGHHPRRRLIVWRKDR
jgi:hypothetical protein